MRKVSLGFAIGLALGTVVPAAAATIVGRTGYLFGWEVVVGGRTACYDPYVWVSSRQIECS